MDTAKITFLILLSFVAVEIQASTFNFTGSLYNSPGGVLGHVFQGTKPQVENGRIRTAPNFTFGTADGKQVGFTASRTSAIATSRVGSAVVSASRLLGPVGIGVTAATLICSETNICQNALDQWEKSGDPAINGYPTSLAVAGFYYVAGLTSYKYPTPEIGCSSGASVDKFWGEGKTGSGGGTGPTACTITTTATGATFETSIAFAPGTCPTGYTSNGSGGCTLVGNPEGSPVTDSDWDTAAPLLNNDDFAQPLIDAGQPLPVQDTDVMAPQNFISGSTTTINKDSNGVATGSTVTTKTVSITDTSTANNPNQFEIQEKTVVNNYDINNTLIDSSETIINNEQPSEPTPEEDTEIKFDTVAAQVLPVSEFLADFNTTSWGSGSCPADINMSLSSGAIGWPIQPFCDLATSMKPIVLLIASILAATIILRSRTTT